jgi:membrane peptidoglycan carboxypeptidase
MARTHQKKTSQGERAREVRRPVRLHEHRRAGASFRKKLVSRILGIMGVLFVCGLVGGLAFAAGGYLGLIESVQRLDEPRTYETHPTYIYSVPLGANEDSRRVIGTIFEGQNHKTASLSEMPPHLLDAVVAKEDERFREHGGVDLWGIMRALWVDIRAGEAVEGASTITQQYVRNAYLSHDQSITRKIKEALIAIEVERKEDSKDQIIADYLNTVYFGNNAYGVEAAAETYFNKSVEDLSVAESASLIGLLWSPSTLGEDRVGAQYQRDLVLTKMFDTGYIASQDYNRALEEPLPENWPANTPTRSGFTGPALTRDFAQYTHDELIRRYGVNTVLEGDLSVYTTIDPEKQLAAHEIAYGTSGYLPDGDDPDLALVTLEPGTGRIKTMVGDRDEDSQFNLVTQGRRQPGSSFKPFALIAALEQGIDPNTRYVSEKKTYQVDVGTGKPETWKVQNYDGIVRGEISLKEALWKSDNTVFADLAMNTGGRGLKNGPEEIADVARRCGISTALPEHPKPSIVLGAYEVSPLDMASAYATIANGGRRVEPTAISKVVSHEVDDDENVLYVAPEHPDGEQVISENVANEAIGIMVGDVTEGIAKDASLGDRPVAGKTGTSENFFDAWFIGFTPELVTGTWMGYAKGGHTLEYVLDYARKLHGLSGGITPAEIWKTYTKVILSGEPIEQFDGVKIPERANPAADSKPRVKNDPDAARRRSPASPEARRPVPEPRRGAAAASASASSIFPSRPREPGARRAGAARYGSASSSASAEPR